MRRRYRDYNYSKKKDLPTKEALIIGISLLILGFYYFVIRPIINYVKSHLALFITIGIIILILFVLSIIFYIRFRIKIKKEEDIFEKEQIEKGLIKFIDRLKNERWGKPKEVKKWAKEDEEAKDKEKLINQVISEIEKFRPSRKYHNEFPYQIELIGFLKSKFPNAEIEQQKGSSRPDIVIGDVAIEIKGPTRTNELQTIADKCMRYYQHFGQLIIVLFEVDVYEPRYQEWVKGIKNTFQQVKIIRK